MKPIIVLITTITAFASLAWADRGFAHEYETGHIERSIEVIVRGQKIQVKYSVGLADETIVNWLAREGLLEKDAEAGYRKSIADLESKTPEKKDQSTDESGDQKQKQQKKEEPEAKIVQPLAFQTELMQLLRDQLAKSVCDKIQLSIDGEELEFLDSSVTNSARHHVAMEIVLVAELASATTTELVLVDRNFLELAENEVAQPAKVDSEAVTGSFKETEKKLRYFGNIRLACRVKGNAIQLNSNVAPVLARAKPIDVGSITHDERIEAATIRTKIGFAKSKAP